MSTLSDLLAEHSDLSGSAVARLQAVVSEWQLLADLSFSDLLLWVPTGHGVMICAAQARPTTGVTAFVGAGVAQAVDVPNRFTSGGIRRRRRGSRIERVERRAADAGDPGLA